MKVREDTIILSTGKEIYVNCGIIGLSEKLDTMSGGYDDTIDVFNELTKEEYIEICDYMIKLWKEYKDIKTNEGHF